MRPTEKNELLPCPFCGGEAERVDIEDGDNAGGSFVHCTECDASGNIEFGFKENFMSNWNRRILTAARAVEAGAGEIWHRADGSRGDVLLYTLRQDGWRKGKPVMVNDMMVRIERTNGSDTDVGSVVNRILSALTPASSAVEGEECPICAEPLKPSDLCATDIEMGTCHAACLEGSPVVDLETGEPSDGPIRTFRFDEGANPPSAVEGEAAYWVAETRMGLVPAAPYQPHAIPLYRHPAPTPAGDWRLVPQSAIDWLLGEGPDANGIHFGDDLKGGEPRYWWRAHLRKLLAASPAPHQEGR